MIRVEDLLLLLILVEFKLSILTKSNEKRYNRTFIFPWFEEEKRQMFGGTCNIFNSAAAIEHFNLAFFSFSKRRLFDAHC